MLEHALAQSWGGGDQMSLIRHLGFAALLSGLGVLRGGPSHELGIEAWGAAMVSKLIRW